MSDTLPYNGEDKLEEALALLSAGLSVDEVLAEAGEAATWLRPMLQMADEVRDLSPALPIPAPETSLEKMLTHAEKGAGSPTPLPPAKSGWLNSISSLWHGSLRLAAAGLIFLIFLGTIGGSLWLVGQNSLPGQSLYGVKQAGEALQLTLTFNGNRREQLEQNFNQRRLEEVKQLLAQNKRVEVVFVGLVEQVNSTTVQIAGLNGDITSETKINGVLNAQARVQVMAVTQPPNRLRLLVIAVLEPGPTPTPQPTATPTRTVTPRPTETSSPVPTTTTTATPIPSSTPSPLPTATPTQPASPTPVLTEAAPRPTADDGGDNPDNQNENSNDDGQGDNSGSGGGNGGGGSGSDNGGSGGGGNDSGDNDNSGSDDGGSGSSGGGDSSDDSNSGSGGGGDDDKGGNSGSGSDNSGSGSGNSGKGKNDND